MAKVPLVVPTGTDSRLLQNATYNSQGVLKSKLNINLLNLCYPSNPTYTMNSDMKLGALWLFLTVGGVNPIRRPVETQNTFTFVSGSTTLMKCNFVYTFSILGQTNTFTVNISLNLATSEIELNYTKTGAPAFEIYGFDIAGHINN